MCMCVLIYTQIRKHKHLLAESSEEWTGGLENKRPRQGRLLAAGRVQSKLLSRADKGTPARLAPAPAGTALAAAPSSQLPYTNRPPPTPTALCLPGEAPRLPGPCVSSSTAPHPLCPRRADPTVVCPLHSVSPVLCVLPEASMCRLNQ